ncbi:putative reverse transcriptase domain-containing protein [Tanacetum coccineum]
MPPMSSPLTQAAVRRMIKESVDVAIASERARHANTRNNASGYRQARCTKGVVELRRWFEKTEMTFRINECAEDMKVKFATATLRGPALTWWISKVVILGLDVANQMGWTEMKKLMTSEFYPAEELGNNSAKSNNKDNSRQSSQNNQKQGNARVMTTAPNEGKVSSGSLYVCERCFTHHVGQCTIKFYKCGMVGHKARYCKEKNVAMGANAQRVWTCNDCGEQGHTRNRCPKKVKKEEVGEARGRAYVIKDAESQVRKSAMKTPEKKTPSCNS